MSERKREGEDEEIQFSYSRSEDSKITTCVSCRAQSMNQLFEKLESTQVTQK